MKINTLFLIMAITCQFYSMIAVPIKNNHISNKNVHVPSIVKPNGPWGSSTDFRRQLRTFNQEDLNNSLLFDGNTTLHYAAYYGCGKEINIMLKAGANPASKNIDGKIPYG